MGFSGISYYRHFISKVIAYLKGKVTSYQGTPYKTTVHTSLIIKGVTTCHLNLIVTSYQSVPPSQYEYLDSKL